MEGLDLTFKHCFMTKLCLCTKNLIYVFVVIDPKGLECESSPLETIL